MNRNRKEHSQELNAAEAPKPFDWPLAFEAETFLRKRIDDFR
jgi:hypothetical protein